MLHPFSSSISPISSLVSSNPLFVFFIFFSQTSFNAPHTFNLFCTPSCTLSWLIYLLSLHLSLGTPEFVIIGFFQPALSINCLIIIQALEVCLLQIFAPVTLFSRIHPPTLSQQYRTARISFVNILSVGCSVRPPGSICSIKLPYPLVVTHVCTSQLTSWIQPDFHTSTDYSHLALLFAADLLLVR